LRRCPQHRLCLTGREEAPLIDDYAVAFFEAYLKHRKEPLLTAANPALPVHQLKLPRR
jgi:hypothetical protein